MEQSLRNTAWGALLGGGLALTIFGLWYYAAVSLTGPEKEIAVPATEKRDITVDVGESTAIEVPVESAAESREAHAEESPESLELESGETPEESGAYPDEGLSPGFVIVPTLVGVAGGALLGWLAGFFVRFRYLKLVGCAAGLYVVAAWIVGGALVIVTSIDRGGADPDGVGLFFDSIEAGLIGALILSPICGPLILALVFALERLTQPTRLESSAVD
ncbi:MAG: hypothetical protein NXI24_17560 [bacterium]|nr:hypothetical protein [bacterium]